MSNTPSPILSVRNLKVVFPTAAGNVRAVEGIDLSVKPGHCLALVGESGCGKTVTGSAIMRLLETPPALVRADELVFDGKDLQHLPEAELQQIRGKDLCMIFQDALTALNPVMTIGRQLDEVFLKHSSMDKKQAKEASIEALRRVGVPSPEKRYRSYPHQLSGGMRQRVLIAMAFAVSPKLIIADEPTTALDVTIQAQVLEELKKLQKEHNTALILITHDLSVVAHMADEICVMYCGKIVEKATREQLFLSPAHPYTEGLLSSVPRLTEKRTQFIRIPDNVPSPMAKPSGCYFSTRCSYCTEECKATMPPLQDIGDGRLCRCHHPLQEKNT